MERRKITVLMSVYNTPREQLKQSIESILNQTYTNFEFLIICDGIKKEDIDFIKSYQDERIRIEINNNNIGLVKSLNKGINLAKGEYLVRMDTDDFSYPERIETQIKFAETHPEYAIISSRADFFDDKGVYGTSKIYGEISKDNLFKGNPCIHPTMLINKKTIQKIGGYPNFLRCEDYAMVMQMMAEGERIYVLDDVLLKYRMDQQGYKKKKFKDRFIEIKMKIIYFKKLNANLYQYMFAFKPFVAGLIPSKIMQLYLKNKLK